MIAVAVAIFVASEPGAARLAALLALGVESFIAAALLLGRFGVATFDLDGVPREAITPGVLAATVLGATLLCGLYPFVPWRYEPRAVPPPLASLRGVALFPIGVAGSVLALRLLAASGAPITSLPLPDVPLAWQALLLLLILTLTALAVLFGPREARMRRALTGASFIVLVAALSFLHLSHVIAILALLTVLYATVASAAVVEEWQVARFDVRLGVLWAAIASGAPLALAGALFGLLASAVALVLEVMPIPSGARVGVSTGARVLVVIGPFLTLAGLATTPDPIVGSLCAVTLVIAGLLELAHAARGVSADAVKPRGRLYATAAALAMTSVFGLIVSLPVTRAAMALFAPTPADWSDLVMVALA